MVLERFLKQYWPYIAIVVCFLVLNVYIFNEWQDDRQYSHLKPFKKIVDDEIVPPDERLPPPKEFDAHVELARSAISRAVSADCKLKLHNEASRVEDGTFTDKFPVSQCPNHDESLVDERIGCFSDSKDARVLKEYEYKFLMTSSRTMCRKHCYSAGFLLYGVEYGVECYCGNEIVNGTEIDVDECLKYKCQGNQDEYCGGFNAIEIFRTGFKSTVTPIKPKYLPVSEFDENAVPAVKILFLLQLNGRNERQVKRFLKSIYLPHHYYYIHVDKRQNYMFSEMEKVAEKVDNILMTNNRFSTIWGGASLLQMFQQVIKETLEIEKFQDWDYIINFSESDFPILPIEDFERLITANNGKSFLASHGYNTGKFIHKQGFEFVFSECDNRMFRIGKRDFPENLRIDGGSDWVGIHRDLAIYSVSDEELPTKLRKMFESILLPLESFYHTLSFNSKFCDSLIMSNLRLTNWYRKQGCRCASLKPIVDWCGCSPLVFREDTRKKYQLETAKGKPTYFARKFDSMIDIESIEEAERQSVNPDMIQKDHPAYHFAFANIYKDGIDEEKIHFKTLAKYALKHSKIKATLEKVARIDAFRAQHNAQIEIVMVLETSEGEHQFLIHRHHQTTFSHPAPEVAGYILRDVAYGTKFEWKEEICREYMGFVTDKDMFHVRLQWEASERVIGGTSKTSPEILFNYLSGPYGNESFSKSRVNPYDSAFGGQFDSLPISKKLPNITNCNPTLVQIVSPELLPQSPPLATLRFPVYTANNVHCHDKLFDDFFRIKDFCSSAESCKKKVWSTSFPDPKSDITFGYDPDTNTLH